jgi:hypothetical protein
MPFTVCVGLLVDLFFFVFSCVILCDMCICVRDMCIVYATCAFMCYLVVVILHPGKILFAVSNKSNVIRVFNGTNVFAYVRAAILLNHRSL